MPFRFNTFEQNSIAGKLNDDIGFRQNATLGYCLFHCGFRDRRWLGERARTRTAVVNREKGRCATEPEGKRLPR